MQVSQTTTMGGSSRPQSITVGSFNSLLQKAKYHCQEGDGLRAVHAYTEALKEYQSAISIREAVSGRYHLETEDLYFELFACRERLHEYEAQLEAERTSMSIALYRHMSLSGTCLDDYHEHGDYCTIRSILIVHKGLYSKQVEEYIANHRKSVAYEKIGDIHRAVGNYDAAIAEYNMAISIEEGAIGRNGPTRSFLCRKVACIAYFLAAAAAEMIANDGAKVLSLTIQSRHVNWKMADKISSKWLKEVTRNMSVHSHGVHTDIVVAIMNGDGLYHSQDFNAAILEYQWAARIKPGGGGGGAGDDGMDLMSDLVIDEAGSSNSNSRESTVTETHDDQSTTNAVSAMIDLLHGEFDKVHSHMDILEEKIDSSCVRLRKRVNKKLDKVLSSMDNICEKVSSELEVVPVKDRSTTSFLTDEISASRTLCNDQHMVSPCKSAWKCSDLSWTKCLFSLWITDRNVQAGTTRAPTSDDTGATPKGPPTCAPYCSKGEHLWEEPSLEESQQQ
jgi:tetratricopeptide (TPR) repeat protein